MKSIGIYGGSFNPPHLGHLIVVDSVCEQLGLDKVIFIPASTPPHKLGVALAPSLDRYEMTALAIRHNSLFEVSDLEIHREGYSYTIDTILQLEVLYPKAKFSLLIGADNFVDIESWKSLEEIIAKVDLVVMNRPEYSIARHSGKYARMARFVTVPAIGISSTDIRRRVKQGRSIRYLVPKEVEQYIYIKGLYRE